jgi:hypothetical protein
MRLSRLARRERGGPAAAHIIHDIQPGGVLGKHARTDLDIARDELMSHIHRCGVLKASQEQQVQWLEETMQFMAERYPGLSEADLVELHQIGRRFCQPVISRAENPAETEMESDSAKDSEQGEMAGAA